MHLSGELPFRMLFTLCEYSDSYLDIISFQPKSGL